MKVLGMSLLMMACLAAPARAELLSLDIDRMRSELGVVLHYGGLLGLFQKEHRMPLDRWIASVRYDPENPMHSRVQVVVPAPLLTLGADAPADLQAQLLGPKGVDATHFPQIRFSSTAVMPGDKKDELKIVGELALRGKVRLIQFVVRVQDAENGTFRFTGRIRFKQSEFGIESQAKDEIEVPFDFYTRPRTAVAFRFKAASNPQRS